MNAFDANDMKAMEPTEKVGLLATINPDGLPHVTMITTIQAKTPTRLIWGQFTEGLSKEHVKDNPNTAFLIMTIDRRIWRGKAKYDRAVKDGEDYEMFNRKPMFRYNSYFGINTVHYMDLVHYNGGEKLRLGGIAVSSLITRAARKSVGIKGSDSILTHWGMGLFNGLINPKFICYKGEDGFPWIIPLLQCQASDRSRLVFSPLAYNDELQMIQAGSKVAIFGLTFKAENILVRGDFIGFERRAGVKLGIIDIDWVYNSMPPNHGQIYPMKELRPVIDF